MDWWTDGLIDWLMDGWMDGLIDWLNKWLIDWLIDWLFSWLIDWLIDWLIKWTFTWHYQSHFQLKRKHLQSQNFHIQKTLMHWNTDSMLFHTALANSGGKFLLVSVKQLLYLFLKTASRFRNVKIVHVDLAKYLLKMSGIYD